MMLTILSLGIVCLKRAFCWNRLEPRAGSSSRNCQASCPLQPSQGLKISWVPLFGINNQHSTAISPFPTSLFRKGSVSDCVLHPGSRPIQRVSGLLSFKSHIAYPWVTEWLLLPCQFAGSIPAAVLPTGSRALPSSRFPFPCKTGRRTGGGTSEGLAGLYIYRLI